MKNAEKEYKELLASGMFWEFYPQLSGEWQKDEQQWNDIYNEAVGLRGKL